VKFGYISTVMRGFFLLLLSLALLFSALDVSAQGRPGASQATATPAPQSPATPAPQTPAPQTPAPQGDAPSVNFNQTGVFEPQDLERITIEIPRDGSTYITFLKRFVVTSGSATKNVQMDFTFSSIILRHNGVTPGNANISLRMVDGRTVFVAARSMSKPAEDRYAYIR